MQTFPGLNDPDTDAKDSVTGTSEVTSTADVPRRRVATPASGQFRTMIETVRAKNDRTGNVFGGIFKLAHHRRVLLLNINVDCDVKWHMI
jgi:hypothetical protein